MEDKIFDDDDIIDLTDLLEEGEPSKKDKAMYEDATDLKAHVNEPDSFDLGKEISMEYEVSVEEIDHGGEGLDMDVSLSSNEKVVLAGERDGEEAMPEPGFVFDDDLPPASGPADLAAEEDDTLPEETQDDTYVISEEEERGELDLGGPEASETVFEEDKPLEPSLEVEEFSGLEGELETPARQEEAPEIDPYEDEAEAAAEKEPARDMIPPRVSEESLAGLRREMPVMLESIVRPLMAELVREMISATREQLPGIVEKVIREEIEKLKKLDS